MQWREPSQLSAGDTICFTRKLPLYAASQGWSLEYAARGGAQVINFVSVASGDNHLVTVPAAVTETWIPAEYQLEGWALNVDGIRKQIYLAALLVAPDLASAPGDIDVTTHAQRMLASIETELEKLAQNVLDETDVEGTKIIRAKRLELASQRNHYLQERRKEIAKENAKSGKPTGRKIKSFLYVTSPGINSSRVFGAGNSVWNLQDP
jgi:hypothetical protein